MNCNEVADHFVLFTTKKTLSTLTNEIIHVNLNLAFAINISDGKTTALFGTGSGVGQSSILTTTPILSTFWVFSGG